MKSKKIVSILLVMTLLVAGIFTGCSKDDKDTDADKADNSSVTENKKDVDNEEDKGEGKKDDCSEPVELLWYQIGTPQKDTDMVFEEVNKYLKDKINATVNMVMYDWGDYNDKMQVIVNSGEKYDICFTCSWANDYRGNAQKGAFLELNDLLDEYGQDIKKTINPNFLEGSKIDGKNYAIPVNKELGAQVVWNVNVGIAEKYGIDYKKFTDLESLKPALEKVKQGEGDGFVPFNADGAWLKAIIPYEEVLPPFGVYFDSNDPKNTDYKIVNMVDTPEMKQLAKTMREFYQAGYIRKDVVTNPDVEDINKTGKWFINAYHYMPYNEISDSTSKGYKVDVVPVGKPTVQNWSTTGSMHAISVASEHPERAMMFLNLLNTDKDLRVLVGSGIEGVHYEIKDGRQVPIKPANENYQVPQFAMGNVFLTNLGPDDPEDKWEAFEKFNNESVPAPCLGFWPDTSNIDNELSAINNVKEEFEKIIFNGTVDPDEYLPKYIDKLNKAGAQKVIDELQKQLDEWKASKK